VVLSIDATLAARARDVRKPTVFDGLLSALWTSRNMTEDDYGLTGGGAAEFLESNVTWAEVTSAHAVVPNDDFLADIARVASQVSNALEPGVTDPSKRQMSPVAELARGNTANTSILNTSPQVRGMYQDLMADTTSEMNAPGAAPVVPSATRQTAPGAVPAGPSAAAGGAYDRVGGPRPGAPTTGSAATDPRVRP
jgi:hypothetical protein